MIRTTVLLAAVFALSACGTSSRTFTPPPVYDEATDRQNPNMTPDTPDEMAEQEAAIELTREADAIRDMPASELSLNDRARLREIDGELRSMRMTVLSGGRSSDHISTLGIDEAMRREAESTE